MNFLDYAFMVLAAWFASFLLVNESGPFDVFVKIRAVKQLTRLLDCIRCTSVYVSFFVCVVYFVSFLPSVHPAYSFIVWLATAGGVLLVDNFFYSMEG